MTPTTPSSLVANTSDDRLQSLFPDPAVSAKATRSRRARTAVVTAVVVALVGGGIAAAGASDSGTSRYRTAIVADHDVDALYEGVASVEAVTQATVSFPVAGTVDAVNVAVGDTVATGAALASLDTTSLNETLHTKQAALAQAELALANALASEEAADDAAAATTTTAARTATSNNDAAKRAVTDTQKMVDSALAAAATAAVAADDVCADPASPASTTTTMPVPSTTSTTATSAPTTSATTTSATTTSTASTTVPIATVPIADVASCRIALREVSRTQAAVTSAQTALATASSALDAALTSTSGSATSPSAATPSASTPVTSSSASSDNFSAGGQGASTVSTSAEGLIAGQKAVDAAALEVIVAEHAITQSDVVAPIAGTVVAVGLAVGDDVTAASATAAVTIVGSGGYEITTTVSVDRVPEIAVGRPATVVVDGTSDELAGEVVSIGVAPDANSSSSAYRVVIGLTGSEASGNEALRTGATASVSIVTDSTTSALAVPTSAVTTTGEQHTVAVLTGSGDDLTTKDVDVTVGVVGDTWTEIRSGLTSGERVVLADLDEALPGSATETSGGTTTNTNGFPGGGSFPAGGPPAGMRPAG